MRLGQVGRLLEQVSGTDRQDADRQRRQLGQRRPVVRVVDVDAGHEGLLVLIAGRGWFRAGRAAHAACTDLPDCDRLDGLGAERAADLAVTPDPRREHQAVNHGVAIKGQPGLVASHLDPDGFACLTLGLDRVQAHRPDRHAVPRGRLPVLVLVVRLRPSPGWPRGTGCRPCRSEVA